MTFERRHAVLLSFASLAILTYLDRLCISIAGPRMQSELALSPEQWGWVVGIFAVSYGGLEIPAGALGDRFGQRRVITRIVIWWSLFTALTGSVSSFAALVAIRFLFGAGEAGAFPNMAGALSRWFPPGERAFTQGSVWGASRLGGVIAPLAVVPMMAWLGWRASFWIFGVIGIVWALVWSRWYQDSPSRAQPSGHTQIPWRKLFGARSLWMIMLMYSLYGWGSYFYLSWLHTYLVKGRGLTEQEMGIFSTLPFILGACSNFVGGLLSDRLARRFGFRNGRRLIGSASLAAGALCVLATALTEGKLLGIILISAGYGFMDLMLPSAWAMCLDIGGRYAGAVSGAMNSSGHIGGFSCSVLFGYLVQRYGSYETPLFVIAAMLLLAALVFSQIDASKTIVEDAA